jgi:hypothetical protein
MVRRGCMRCALPRSDCAQGFTPAATAVSILFEENVYCGDSSSTFFTVLWINKCRCSFAA